MRRSLAALVAAASVSLSGIVPAAAQGTPGLSEARERAADAAGAMHEVEEALGRLDGEVTRLQAEQETAQAELDRLRVKVQHLAVERYMETDRDLFFMPGDDLNEQGRARALAEMVAQTDRDSIDQYRATKARLDEASAELQTKQDDQREQLDALQSRKAELEAELARLEELEATRLEEERRQAEEQARRDRDEEARRRAEQLEARQAAIAAGKEAARTGGSAQPPPPPAGGAAGPPPAPIASGSWVCPVQGPRTFRDSWGEPRSGGRSHRGVDIMSPRGTPVVTPVSGTVSLRGDRLGGLSFHLQGDDGNYYYGTHLDAYAGPSGRLAAGTVVGYVGDTGNAVGTHLHFEIHKGSYGNAVNPYPTVARHC